MLPYLLNAIYLAAALLALPLLIHGAILKNKYREGWRAKLLGQVPRRTGDRQCVWLHAVSLGEVNLFQTLLPRLCRQFPSTDFVVSVTTKTAYDFAQTTFPQYTVCYCPLDFSWAVSTALSRLRPDVLVLAEAELWPNLIMRARGAGARVVLINGRLSDKSFRGYRRIRWLLARLARACALIAVQTDQYADRFLLLGAAAETVRVTGSMKFDGARSNRQHPSVRRLARLAGLEPGDQVFLAGSTQAPEESLAISAFQALRDEHPGLRLILVPRHPHRFDQVADQLRDAGISFQRRTRLEREGPVRTKRVLLVDTIGELAAWWGTASIAFVGGSMGQRGGQNMIEPAAYGAAVAFGPNTQNFRDVVSLLLSADAAVVVRDGAELTGFVRRCLDEPQFCTRLGRNASQLVAEQQGATQRTVELIRPLLDAGPESAVVRWPAA